jgi:hypothetical protein
LVTNWLDDAKAPATELAALYHRRWKIEMVRISGHGGQRFSLKADTISS